MGFLAFIVAALGLALAMAGAWAAQRATGKSGWIDTVWSFATGVAGVFVCLFSGTTGGRPAFVALLVGFWSLRLGAHIAVRTLDGREDPRYAALAAEWGADFSRRLFWFAQVQAVAAFALVISVGAAAANPAPFPRVADGLGLIVFLIALAGESVADIQLARFRATHRHSPDICEVGLWRWSRHPNYFFEWLIWVAYPLIAINLSRDYPLGWAALLAPAFMYVLLAHISGVPPLEAHMLASRGGAFRSLQRRVNAFFPGPRRAPAPIPVADKESHP